MSLAYKQAPSPFTGGHSQQHYSMDAHLRRIAPNGYDLEFVQIRGRFSYRHDFRHGDILAVAIADATHGPRDSLWIMAIGETHFIRERSEVDGLMSRARLQLVGAAAPTAKIVGRVVMTLRPHATEGDSFF